MYDANAQRKGSIADKIKSLSVQFFMIMMMSVQKNGICFMENIVRGERERVEECEITLENVGPGFLI